MSKANVDALRQAADFFNEGDLDALAATGFYADDVEFHENPRLPEAAVYRGRDAVFGYFRRFLEAFDDYSFDIEEIVDAGDHVVLFNRQRARGRESHAEVEMRSAWVVGFREGMIVRITPYFERGEALRAAGVREP
jgi:ketosteroid isomerase-like protein